jgi:hypothetical protein
MSKLDRAKRLIGREIQRPEGSVRVLGVHWMAAGSHLCLSPSGELVIHSPEETKTAWEKIKDAPFEDRKEMWPGEVFTGSAVLSGLYFRVLYKVTGRQGLIKVPSRIRQKDLA